MGHWVTASTPSAQLVPDWKRPCQCYRQGIYDLGFQMHHKNGSYNRSHQVQRIIFEFIGNVDQEPVALRSVGIKRQGELQINPTLFARITGPGKTPDASVALGVH